MRIDIRGVIVSNDDKAVYDWFDMEATCPRDITEKIAQANGDPINVYISSSGGDLWAGQDIYAALQVYDGEVNTFITSRGYSAASIIALAGKLSLYAGATFMMHKVSSAGRGNADDFSKMAEVLTTLDKSICNIYMQKTGKSQEEILELMAKETYFTADEAVEFGLADEIVQMEMKFAASTGQLFSAEQINKIKALLAKPPPANEGGFSIEQKKAKAKLQLLTLGGIRK